MASRASGLRRAVSLNESSPCLHRRSALFERIASAATASRVRKRLTKAGTSSQGK
jgi:hypothetical protein